MSDDELFGAEHVRAYQETDGERGHDWRNGTTILLLTTIGRKTGEERTMPLIYAEDDGRYVIVASKGGMPTHPAWYVNMREQAEVGVQVLGDTFSATHRDADGDEYERLWEKMNGEWPDYANYQKKTDRKIPIVILERA